MVPKRDDVLPTRLDHPSRIQQLLVAPSARLGRQSRSARPAPALEQRLPARARANTDLERALRRQRRRAATHAASTSTTVAAAAEMPRRVGGDDARERLL